MSRQYYLLKSEPEEYSFDELEREGVGRWDGVRNYAARNHLRTMKLGDWAFFYHTGRRKQVVGVVEVARTHYPDPTAEGGDFSAVDVRPVVRLAVPVDLSVIKNDYRLREMPLVRQPRLSVQPVEASEFFCILRLGETCLPES